MARSTAIPGPSCSIQERSHVGIAAAILSCGAGQRSLGCGRGLCAHPSTDARGNSPGVPATRSRDLRARCSPAPMRSRDGEGAECFGRHRTADGCTRLRCCSRRSSSARSDRVCRCCCLHQPLRVRYRLRKTECGNPKVCRRRRPDGSLPAATTLRDTQAA